jgi:hypothetical protein
VIESNRLAHFETGLALLLDNANGGCPTTVSERIVRDST